MIVEFVNNPYPNKEWLNYLKKGQRFLVVEISHDLKKQLIYYHLLDGDDYDSTIAACPWDAFKIICDKIPSNWSFEYYCDSNYFYTNLLPARWATKEWSDSFWSVCHGESTYQEKYRAEEVFLEEAKKIYEECGKGWLPNPFKD
jgi:hypothetical protein